MYSIKYHNKSISNLSFLVTGGAGFIGSNIVEYLIKNKAKRVVVLDNLSTGNLVNIEPFFKEDNFFFIKGDITSLQDCQKSMLNIDYVLHQAALGSVPRSINNPIATNDTNINGFLNILYSAKESKSVKRVVYAASSSTYGDSVELPKKEDVIGRPLSPYAVTKYVNELYADVFFKSYGLESIGLRYFNVFGPRQDPFGDYAAVIPKFIIKFIKNETITINGDGNHSRDFTYVENVVQANIKAVLSDNPKIINKIFNIASGERIYLKNLIDVINIFLNKKNFFSRSEIIYGDERKGDIKHSLADISKADYMLNYKPIFSFKKGINETVNHLYKDHFF